MKLSHIEECCMYCIIISIYVMFHNIVILGSYSSHAASFCGVFDVGQGLDTLVNGLLAWESLPRIRYELFETLPLGAALHAINLHFKLRTPPAPAPESMEEGGFAIRNFQKSQS